MFSTFLECSQMSRVFYLTNKEASTVLCSVVKHAGSGRAQKKCRETRDVVECFSLLLECSTAS